MTAATKAMLGAVSAAGLGYAAGRTRPVREARDWAQRYVVYRQPRDTGRLRRLRMVAAPLVWPEPFAHALWTRACTGAWPTPTQRHPGVPAVVVRHGDDG